MKRRKFLKLLGISAPALALIPEVAKATPSLPVFPDPFSLPVPVSADLLMDSAFNMEQAIIDDVARIYDIPKEMLITGNGSDGGYLLGPDLDMSIACEIVKTKRCKDHR